MIQHVMEKLISVSDYLFATIRHIISLRKKSIFFTEKYTRGVSAVESILTLDRLRQSVAIKELEQTHGQSLSMRKTVSVPNFSQVCHLFATCIKYLLSNESHAFTIHLFLCWIIAEALAIRHSYKS